MASPRVLQEWCRVTCAGYPGVEIKNMSSSFRDGLAFCAIIHKHRPDLIDFSSLCKDNVYQNNKLAFEVAETKLGIPALLDPKDMASCKVPDCLSVLTYLYQYYYVFSGKSCAGPARLWSSHVAISNITHSETSAAAKPPKTSTHMETSTGECFSKTRQAMVCNLCFKPVHLIQRHFVDGKVYHRNCFRCRLCHSTLLPESYTGGNETGSLICTFHPTDDKSTSVEPDQRLGSTGNGPKCKFQAGVYSLGGLAIPSVPHYTKPTETQDRLVCKTSETDGTEREERKDEENSSVGPPRLPRVKDTEEAEKDDPEQKEKPDETKASDVSSTRPVPAPRRISCVGPVPAPRTKPAQMMNGSKASADSSQHSKSTPSPSHVTSSKVKINHPWMNLVHSGPWSQLPPAPPPIPTARSKQVQARQSWGKPRPPPPNPFEEEEDTEGEAAKPGSGNQTEPPVKAVRSEDGLKGGGEAAALETRKGTAEVSGDARQSPNQSRVFPRSLSVPAMTPDHSPCESAASCQSESSSKETQVSQRPTLTKSKTFQDVSSSRPPAPGHGFPLVKRRVQTDRCVSTEDLQVQMRELHEKMEALELKGVELERNLRDYKNDKEEEQMLMEWFSLIHQRHVLSRRDTELVYLSKQQKLDDRQADVEYELRCLLNKPESEWSPEDQGREKQLMKELVTVIEQRNQIISSLEQDRQREREEDKLWEDTGKDKDFQRERLKELKKSKGKFKPSKVFKIMNHKAESSKDSMHKKS